ncbi:acetyl-CoA synthetase [Allostella sp. ATCC 35155]|nr:acetyl-CoA synthetase [Stella sp. ATCC 35155]
MIEAPGTERPFRWDLPERFNFAGDALAARAAEQPLSPAIVWRGRDDREIRISYAEAAAQVAGTAASLLAAGLRPGDRVLVLLPRVPEWHIAMTACMHAGIVPVPSVWMLSAEEIAHRVAAAGIVGAITAAAGIEKFRTCADRLPHRFCVDADLTGWPWLRPGAGSCPPEPMPIDRPALAYFTSGSTGAPKAVIHAARGVLARCWQPWRWLGLGRGDLVWATTDTGWTKAATTQLFGAWYHGATAFMHEAPSPEIVVREVARYGITHLCLSATEIRRILLSGADGAAFSSLRLTVSAGEAVTADLFERWRALTGSELVGGYGQTETPMMLCARPGDSGRDPGMGQPFPGNRIALVDEAGDAVAPGTPGIIGVDRRHPGLMLGYLVDGRLTEGGSLRGDWYLTEDQAEQRADGTFAFVGRSDDVINTAGYRVGPFEVEQALSRHPAVAECAVVPAPDADRGEIIKAVIVVRAGVAASPALAAELQAFVKSQIAPFKYPRRVEFRDSLPKTATGKVLRRALRG